VETTAVIFPQFIGAVAATSGREKDRAVRRLIALIGFGALTALGCGDLGVGDPCAPQRPMGLVCNPAANMTAGCFRGTEIYIETQSLQCRSRICLVYRYDEAADEATPSSGRMLRPKRVFCTCRCGVPASLRATTDESVLCQCPENFVCQTDVAGQQYNPGVQGSYCVRSGP